MTKFWVRISNWEVWGRHLRYTHCQASRNWYISAFVCANILPKNTDAHRSSRRPSEASSLGLLRRAIAPGVRWRQRTVCMCALTSTSLHASGGVHESATGRPHLSDGPSRSHELEYTGALALSLFITWKSPMRVGLSYYPARTQAVVGFPSGNTWRSRDFSCV